MAKKKITAVVIRRTCEPEHTVAILTAEVAPDVIANQDDLYGAFKEAVTAYAAKDPSFRKRIVKENRGDFNIGDVSVNGHDPGFLDELLCWGVYSYELQTHSAPRINWDYDDNLYEPEDED